MDLKIFLTVFVFGLFFAALGAWVGYAAHEQDCRRELAGYCVDDDHEFTTWSFDNRHGLPVIDGKTWRWCPGSCETEGF